MHRQRQQKLTKKKKKKKKQTTKFHYDLLNLNQSKKKKKRRQAQALHHRLHWLENVVDFQLAGSCESKAHKDIPIQTCRDHLDVRDRQIFPKLQFCALASTTFASVAHADVAHASITLH
jgi:hypothetical protein